MEVLQQMVRAYNRSYHRSIKKAPADVYTTNQEEVWQTLYGQPPDTFNKQRAKLKVGDRVRISKARRTFKKGYLPSWTEELFTISRLKKTTPPTYVLKDDNGKELEGTFYQEEVQTVGDKQLYRIETLLEHRPGAGGQREYLVKWFGYDSTFNSWIPQKALRQYSR